MHLCFTGRILERLERTFITFVRSELMSILRDDRDIHDTVNAEKKNNRAQVREQPVLYTDPISDVGYVGSAPSLLTITECYTCRYLR